MNNQQPDALRPADCCDMKANACREGTPPYIERKQTAAELRRLHAENLSLHQSYKAARLEIDSLKAQRAQSAPTDDQVLAITTAYEQGVGKGREAYTLGKKVDNPYSSGWNCDHAWSLGYVEGKGQAERKAQGNQKLSRCSKLDGGSSISGEEHTDVAVPYGVVTTHSVTGQQFFYRWPEPPYLVTLNWSKPYPPDDHIRYDHVVADTPIGEFSIEWKSWKEHDAYCVYLGGQYLTSAPNLDAAKQVASNHLLSVAKALQSDDQWLAVPTADGDPLDTDSPLWQAILKYKRSPEGYHSEQAAKAVDLEILRLVTSSNEVPSVTLDHTLDHLYSGLHSISKSFESSSHCYDDDGAHYQALLDTMQFLRSFSVKDAGLFQRLSQCRQIREHWGSRWSICIEGREPASYSLEDFRTAVDNATRDQ